MTTPLRALFLTDGIDAPGSRFRAEQFFPYLEQRGIRCTLRYAYGRQYNRLFRTMLSTPYRLIARLKRVAWTLTGPAYDVVFLQRTALPQWAGPELLVSALGTPLVFDFDDAVHMTPERRVSRHRKRAFEQALAASTRIIAGNQHLAELAGRDDITEVIPTVIDTDTYVATEPLEQETVTLGWMGTAGNFPSVRHVLPAIFEVLDARPSTRFRLVSNGRLRELQGRPQVEQRLWSRETERDELSAFDIGLMPLIDDEWNRGKCGFKMIQYMGMGRPVVSSPVGANVSIFEGSDAGALSSSHREWVGSLLELADDRPRRLECGRRARAHAVKHYSVRVVLDRLETILRQAAK